MKIKIQRKTNEQWEGGISMSADTYASEENIAEVAQRYFRAAR